MAHAKILYAAGLMLLAACGGNTETGTTDTTTDEQNAAANSAMPADDAAASGEQPTDAAGYMAMAGAGDMWEIESSRAYLAKGTNADLKKFAQMMVDNHTQSTAKIKTAATAANLTPPPPRMNAEQQRMLDEIKSADAGSVDAVYIRNQRMAHDMALALHRGYASNGDTEQLKTAASEIAPVVEKHIAELGRIGSAGAAPAKS